MKITKFDKPVLRMLAGEFESALKPLEDRFGIKFTYKGARFESTSATFKIEGVTANENGEIVPKERTEFNLYSSTYGLPSEVLGKEIEYAGDTYIVTGLNTRSHKFPVTAKRVSDGKGFKLTAAGVISAWNLKNANQPKTN